MLFNGYYQVGGTIHHFKTNRSWEVTANFAHLFADNPGFYGYYHSSGINTPVWFRIWMEGTQLRCLEEFPDDIPKHIRAYHLICQ